MFLPNMLVQSAGFDWAVAMGTGYLLRIPVHSFSTAKVLIKGRYRRTGYYIYWISGFKKSNSEDPATFDQPDLGPIQ